jgi:hypothetical protein
MNERVRTLVEGRKERIRRVLGRELARRPGDPATLSADDREHLLGYARELYENELAWEDITEEERLDDGPLVALAFPGFLAFVRGLLLAEAMPDSLAPASPRPEVVEDVLLFLGARCLALKEELTAGERDADEDARRSVALDMTGQLLDLVLFELYGLDQEEVRAVESVGSVG